MRLQLDSGDADSGVGVDALVTTRDRIIWGGGETTGLLNGQQLRANEYDGIFMLPK